MYMLTCNASTDIWLRQVPALQQRTASALGNAIQSDALTSCHFSLLSRTPD